MKYLKELVVKYIMFIKLKDTDFLNKLNWVSKFINIKSELNIGEELKIIIIFIHHPSDC